MRLFRSITVDVAFVDQFSANVHMLAEQKMSRLLRTVMREDGVVGDSFSVDRIGATKGGNTAASPGGTANPINDRHGNTPLDNTPHTRRWGFLADYDVADLIDRQDRVKMLIDPDSAYTQKHAATMARTIDTIIFAALHGSVSEGHTGSTVTSFDTTNQSIASGSTGLTVAKIRAAKKKLDKNEVDENYKRYFVTSADGIDELLEDEKISSSDYNTVKALVRGEVNTFLGFEFIRTEIAALSTSDFAVSSERPDYAYAQPAIRFAMPRPPSSIAADRPDKRHAKQIYTSLTAGAVRVEDAMVVRVLSVIPS